MLAVDSYKTYRPIAIQSPQWVLCPVWTDLYGSTLRPPLYWLTYSLANKHSSTFLAHVNRTQVDISVKQAVYTRWFETCSMYSTALSSLVNSILIIRSYLSIYIYIYIYIYRSLVDSDNEAGGQQITGVGRGVYGCFTACTHISSEWVCVTVRMDVCATSRAGKNSTVSKDAWS